VLVAGRGPLEDPAAPSWFEDDRQAGVGGDSVIGRPPLADPRRPDVKRMGWRSVEVEGQPDRFDHRRGAVLSASSR